jgi:ribosomal protein L11 methyltransferase
MSCLEFQIPIRTWNNIEREILVARLAEIGFEGFIEQEDQVLAYIASENFSDQSFSSLIDDLAALGMKVQYVFHETPEQNWNEEWEKRFEPVVIKEKVLIRAPFHHSGDDLPCTLIIEPKMSFGTGHHYTTRLMIEAMMNMDLSGKKVLDMGCGTGVLGIYACKMGAASVLGIDNDQWAYENTLENIEKNTAREMEVSFGDVRVLPDVAFDVVLANITRNILVRDLPEYNRHLATGGYLLVSGFLAEDVQFVLNAAYGCGLEHLETAEIFNWISLSFRKTL